MAGPTSFGDLLRRLRLDAGLSQEDLAERSGLSVRAISDLERGQRRRPYRHTVQSLAEALRLPPGDRADLEAAARRGATPALGVIGQPARPQARPTPKVGPGDSQPSEEAEPPVHHNLPAQLTSFVGREREMVEVRALLAKSRLVTLTGTGGCGKTRLALQVVGGLLDNYPDGVWLVDLAPLADPGLVPQAVAFILGLREDSSQPIQARLISHLRPRSLLILLDNCEHLIDACATLTDAILRACPRVRILATSRESLGVAGETSWPVPSLTTPDPDDELAVDRLPGFESVRLFLERAQLVRPAFAITEHNALAVAQICRRLDGMPLAIELAAARTVALPPEEIASRLDDRFRLLTGGRRTAVRRQQTLRATIDWSYGLLSEPERSLLRRLSVFAGGWTLDAAESVCGCDAPGDEPPATPADNRHLTPDTSVVSADVLELLSQLVGKSLVIAEEQDGTAWYRLLETIRQYAGEKLLQAGEAAGIRARHRDWYLALIERLREVFDNRPEGQWLGSIRRMRREKDNLRAAAEWSQAEPEGAETEVRLAEAIGAIACATYGVSTPSSVAREWLAHALGRATRTVSATRTRALHQLGMCEEAIGKPAAARDAFAASLAMSRQLGDTYLVVRNLTWLSAMHEALGDSLRARLLLEESLAVARASGIARHTVTALGNLGSLLIRLGELAAARQHLEEALAVSGREAASGWGWAQVMGELALREGNHARARELLETARSRCQRRGWPAHPHLIYSLGDLARAEGDYEEARSVYLEGLSIAQDREGRVLTIRGLVRLAGLCVASGQVPRAARLLGAVAAWCAGAGLLHPINVQPDYERDLALVRAAMGDLAVARAWAEGQAMTLDEAADDALAETSA